MKSYARLYPQMLERLQQAPAFASREEAALGLRAAWLAVHQEVGASKRLIQILQSARICAEQGWRDIDCNVCYLDSPESPPVRLFVHANGGIVLQRMAPGDNEIIFAKPGKVCLPAL